MEHIDVAVIGAGVTGLASARAIATLGYSTCILERHPRPGLDTSTHNSGVLHAGIYYPPGTLKAQLCVEGRQMLYEFCATYDVPHRKCGKLVVAFDQSEIPGLEALKARGDANGVQHLAIVDADFIAAREPAVHGVAALWSPETGVLDAEALVRALQRSTAECGAIFLPGSKLVGAEHDHEGIRLRTPHETIHARVAVNAAGLYADEVSKTLGGEAFTIYPVRGEYAELVPAKRGLVRGLVYPPPDAHSLGVHLVRTTDGQVWLGPTVRFQDRKDDYEGERLPLEFFAAAAHRLLDAVTVDDLRPGGSGIRAKLHPDSQRFSDFLIRRDRKNPFLVQVAGIESPGLTSCLAVGQLVGRLAAELL
jgi:L-2-hydroxyglutarate oxidase LhgO